MTGEGLVEGVTVVVKDGFIDAIVDADEATIAANTTVIDGTGCYLIPGLADMHVHFFPTDALLFLANGVTLVRNMWGSPLELFLKEAYANGLMLGPELWTAGPLLEGDPPIWQIALRPAKVVTTPEQGRQAVLDTIAAGYDAVKVYSRLLPEVFAAILETANENDFPVWGHVPFAIDVVTAANAGLRSNEHLTEYSILGDPSDEISATIENEMWNCPTLAVWDMVNRLEEILLDLPSVEGLQYVHDLVKALAWEPNVEGILNAEEEARLPVASFFPTVLSLYQAGGHLLVGTDANAAYIVPGFSIHEELRLFVEGVGLPPYEVLRMATYNAAQFLGITDRVGTIEEGKEADLVLLTANPLEDINNTKSRVGVMVDGRWYTNEELFQMLN